MRRAPGYTPEFYQEMFELELRLLIATIDTVKAAPKHFKPKQIDSDLSFVDTDYVMNKLRANFPDLTDEHLQSNLGWVVYWYYRR